MFVFERPTILLKMGNSLIEYLLNLTIGGNAQNNIQIVETFWNHCTKKVPLSPMSYAGEGIQIYHHIVHKCKINHVKHRRIVR